MEHLKGVRCQVLSILLITGIWSGVVRGGTFDPLAFTSLGAFPTGDGWYVADTDAGTLQRGDGTGPLFQGVFADGAAVFTFDSIAMSSGLWVEAIGTRALALLSHGDVDLGFGSGVLANGQVVHGGAGGFGRSNGPGAGLMGLGAGSGGGYGGAGGAGGPLITFDGTVLTGANGGGTYGETGLDLVGGSGGGGWTPGGGGGAIDISAVGALRIEGLISVDGGEGLTVAGGGSGGMIRLAGERIELAAGRTVLSARGGAGSSSLDLGRDGFYGPGGGGGGGRVFLNASQVSLSTDSIDVSGGLGFEDGALGVISSGAVPTIVPEPASLAMAAVGLFGLTVAGRGKRRRDG